MIDALAFAVVGLAGLYLLALGVASLTVPDRASRFLLGFAGSGALHYGEMLLRTVIGAALVLQAPRMFLSGAFNVFGWILLGTTACLLLVPWRWHQRFARQAVPQATRFTGVIGVASVAFGGFILTALVLGSAT